MLTRILALTGALAILLGATTGARAAHLCSMLEAPEEPCCCPHEEPEDQGEQASEPRDQMSRAGCCELRPADQQMLPVPAGALDPAPAIAAAPAQRASIDLPRRRSQATFHGPEPPGPGGPPLYVRHCSYLI